METHLLIQGLHDGRLAREDTGLIISEWMDGVLFISHMQALTGFVKHHGPDWIGLQVIAESHISIHCKPNAVWLDVFSCIPFDVQGVIRYSVDILGLKTHTEQMIARAIPLD